MSTQIPFNLAGLQIGNATIPKEGPKAIPIALDFTAQSSYLVDISNLYAQRLISIIQVIFVDAVDATSDITVNISGTAQRIKVPQGSQGYYPILSPANGTLTFSGAGVAQAFLINVPMSVLTWLNGDGTFAFDNAGNLKTADQNLAALISDGALQVKEVGAASGSPSELIFAGTFNDNFVHYISGGGEPAGDYTYVTELEIGLSGDAWLAASNFHLSITGVNAGDVLAQCYCNLPTAAPANPGPNQLLTRFTGLWKNAQANDHLQVYAPPGLGGGFYYVNLYGYYSST